MPIEKCRECGEAIEMSCPADFTIAGRRLVLDNLQIMDAEFYCAGNDHAVSDEDAAELRKSLRGFDAFGRPPGSGSVGAVLTQPRPEDASQWMPELPDDPLSPASPVPARTDDDEYMELLRRFPPRPLCDDEAYDKAVAVVDAIIDKGEAASVAELDYIDVLGGMIEEYDELYYPTQSPSGRDMLHHYIEARGTTQAAVAEATGIAKSTISAIMAGKRSLTMKHVKLLAAHFHTNPEVFVPDGDEDVYEAEFEPQAWVDDSAVPVALPGEATWDCTAFARQLAGTKVGRRYIRGMYETLSSYLAGPFIDVESAFQADPAAPQWVREWQGPFVIMINRKQPDVY